MSEFHSLNELVRAGESESPRLERKRTRLTSTPDFAPSVNPQACREDAGGGIGATAVELQVACHPVVAPTPVEPDAACPNLQNTGAGYHATQISVNHAQVVALQETPDEIRQHLAELGVNLAEATRGRKHVFDDFM